MPLDADQTRLYLLVADTTWAKLYKTGCPPAQLTLAYHQINFGGGTADASAIEDFAGRLCRILKSDRQAGKFDTLAVIASGAMLAAIRRQLDGGCHDLMLARAVEVPAQLAEPDLIAQLRDMLALSRDAVKPSATIPAEPEASG